MVECYLLNNVLLYKSATPMVLNSIVVADFKNKKNPPKQMA